MNRVIAGLVVAILFALGGCPSAPSRVSDEWPLSRVSKAAVRCLEVLPSVGSSLSKRRIGAIIDPNINTVLIMEIPKATGYILEFNAAPVFPDGPTAICYMDGDSDGVLRAVFRLKVRGILREGDIVLHDRSIFSDLSEGERTKAATMAKYYTFSLDALGVRRQNIE